MSDHTSDYVMMLRTSRSPLGAMYGEKKINDDDMFEDPFFTDVNKALESTDYTHGKYALKSDQSHWDKYA